MTRLGYFFNLALRISTTIMKAPTILPVYDIFTKSSIQERSLLCFPKNLKRSLQNIYRYFIWVTYATETYLTTCAILIQRFGVDTGY